MIGQQRAENSYWIEITPVQWSQEPIQDDQPNSVCPHEDLGVQYDLH